MRAHTGADRDGAIVPACEWSPAWCTRNYEIWYTYAQNSNRAFNRDIDTIVAAGSPLAESDLISTGRISVLAACSDKCRQSARD